MSEKFVFRIGELLNAVSNFNANGKNGKLTIEFVSKPNFIMYFKSIKIENDSDESVGLFGETYVTVDGVNKQIDIIEPDSEEDMFRIYDYSTEETITDWATAVILETDTFKIIVDYINY
jgi:hypothetical protein